MKTYTRWHMSQLSAAMKNLHRAGNVLDAISVEDLPGIPMDVADEYAASVKAMGEATKQLRAALKKVTAALRGKA